MEESSTEEEGSASLEEDSSTSEEDSSSLEEDSSSLEEDSCSSDEGSAYFLTGDYPSPRLIAYARIFLCRFVRSTPSITAVREMFHPLIFSVSTM